VSSNLIPAAQRANADIAGRTTFPGETNAGTPAAPSPGEIVQSVVHTAPLDWLFRQEPLSLTTESKAPATPTTAQRGPHGGLVPASVSNIVRGVLAPSPGPGPGSTDNTPTADTPSDRGNIGFRPGAWETAPVVNVKGAWASIRRALGV